MATKKTAPPKKALPEGTDGAVAAVNGDAVILIPRLDAQRVLVPIRGTAPLVAHRFGEKARRMMLDNMQGRKSPKEPKDPEREFSAAMYRFSKDDDRYGFPAIGFKSATVSGARFYRSVTMVALRQLLMFDGELGLDGQKLVEIVSPEPPVMREDVVRVGNGGTDLRYRPMWTNWTATLAISYVATSISLESVIALVNAGGLGVGIGEWRVEKKGDFGTYEVDDSVELRVVQ